MHLKPKYIFLASEKRKKIQLESNLAIVFNQKDFWRLLQEENCIFICVLISFYPLYYWLQANTKEEGISALHLSASRGNLQISKVLVEAGADVNHENAHGDTPLHTCM